MDIPAGLFLFLIGLASPALALPAAIGGFLLRRVRWIVPVLAVVVPVLLWLAARPGRFDPYTLVMIPAAALWAWAGRRFGLWLGRRR